MTGKIIEALIWGFAAGIVGVAYIQILAKEETFNFWWRFGARFEKRWYFKPVWGCAFCFAGQFAAWTFTLLRIIPAMIAEIRLNGWLSLHSIHYATTGATFLFCLIIATAAAIVTAKTISFLFVKNGIQ